MLLCSVFSSSGAAASRKEQAKREVPAGGTPEYKPLSTRAHGTKEASSSWLSHYPLAPFRRFGLG